MTCTNHNYSCSTFWLHDSTTWICGIKPWKFFKERLFGIEFSTTAKGSGLRKHQHNTINFVSDPIMIAKLLPFYSTDTRVRTTAHCIVWRLTSIIICAARQRVRKHVRHVVKASTNRKRTDAKCTNWFSFVEILFFFSCGFRYFLHFAIWQSGGHNYHKFIISRCSAHTIVGQEYFDCLVEFLFLIWWAKKNQFRLRRSRRL